MIYNRIDVVHPFQVIEAARIIDRDGPPIDYCAAKLPSSGIYCNNVVETKDMDVLCGDMTTMVSRSTLGRCGGKACFYGSEFYDNGP